MHTVRQLQRGPGGRLTERVDPGGGVFVPSPTCGITMPVYAAGFPDSAIKDPIFTCPVSAIPDAVWSLLALWRECQAFRALPLPGGVCDQPMSVRRAFPVFDRLARVEEAHRQAAGAMASQAALLRAVMRGAP